MKQTPSPKLMTLKAQIEQLLTVHEKIFNEEYEASVENLSRQEREPVDENYAEAIPRKHNSYSEWF